MNSAIVILDDRRVAITSRVLLKYAADEGLHVLPVGVTADVDVREAPFGALGGDCRRRHAMRLHQRVRRATQTEVCIISLHCCLCGKGRGSRDNADRGSCQVSRLRDPFRVLFAGMTGRIG